MKDNLFQIEESDKVLKVIIPRSFNQLPKFKKKKLANGYFFFLPIFVVLFYFAFIQPSQYQMDIYYSYSAICLIYFLIPLLVRVVKIKPLIWEFSDSQAKMGSKMFPTKDITNVSIKKHHVKKRTSFSTHAGRMGVEQNNEFNYFEINFISGKRKVLYRKLFDGIENHGLYGLVDKINEKIKKGE